MPSINEIATRAARTKKPSKARAHIIVREMIERGTLPPPDELAMLYRFFMPAVPAKPKTDEQWVARAVSNGDIRQCLNFLYSDGIRIAGCDGYRLHVAPTTLAPGYYDAALTAVGDQGQYPDIDRLLPEWTEKNALSVDPDTLPVEEHKYTCYRLPCGGLVQKRYWDDAASGETVRYVRAGNMCRLELPGPRTAVIMLVAE